MSNEFIETIAPIVQEIAPDYNILCCSSVIAQACIESNFGKSDLATKHHNYFGMKSGHEWKGKTAEYRTKEEYVKGKLKTITASFRSYETEREGIIGYFEFLQFPRYHNLRGVSDYRMFNSLIKDDGWATSFTYTETLNKIIEKYRLTDYDYLSFEEKVADSKKSIDDIANEVIKGLWGTGNVRKQRLKMHGYDYKAVQDLVNKKLS